MQIEYEITKREKDIMKVLWSEKESLTASEIAKRTDEISISTVQSALKNLVRKGLAEVAHPHLPKGLQRLINWRAVLICLIR